MHSQNVVVLMKTLVASVGGNQTKIGLMQKWKRGIDYELIDHLFTEAY